MTTVQPHETTSNGRQAELDAARLLLDRMGWATPVASAHGLALLAEPDEALLDVKVGPAQRKGPPRRQAVSVQA